ncbi:hypothetical protein SDJN02_06398, partial [Cucurbita argyrosperma subsp. argyrosperma]
MGAVQVALEVYFRCAWRRATGTIYKLKKLLNCLEEQFIMQHSETRSVTELLLVSPDYSSPYHVHMHIVY